MGSIIKKLGAIVAVVFFANVNSAVAETFIAISSQVLTGNQLPFLSHTGPGSFDNALAMNIPYGPVAQIRHQLSGALNYPLNTFKGWNPTGEAHVTVITPPEYANILGKYLSIKEINEIAIRYGIQSSDIQILGLGSGQALIDQQKQVTFFLIVCSKNLLLIREQIYFEYLKRGGPKGAWNPMHFYPHITVGFTLRDLHEQDGVIKDITHSLDPRFQLFWENSDSN